MSWELALALGELKSRVSAIERELSTIKHWALRFCILLALWVSALVANMNTETMAQLLVGVLKAL
jgi:hypothetical protein